MIKLLKQSIFLMSVTLLFVCIVSFSVYFFFREGFFGQEELLQKEKIGTSASSIFFHNLFFEGIFILPFIGSIYFVFSFLMISIDIGIHLVSKGILDTIQLLRHLPLEIFSFSLLLVASRLYRKKEIKHSKMFMAKVFVLSILILLLSAMVEFYQKR